MTEATAVTACPMEPGESVTYWDLICLRGLDKDHEVACACDERRAVRMFGILPEDITRDGMAHWCDVLLAPVTRLDASDEVPLIVLGPPATVRRLETFACCFADYLSRNDVWGMRDGRDRDALQGMRDAVRGKVRTVLRPRHGAVAGDHGMSCGTRRRKEAIAWIRASR